MPKSSAGAIRVSWTLLKMIKQLPVYEYSKGRQENNKISLIGDIVSEIPILKFCFKYSNCS